MVSTRQRRRVRARAEAGFTLIEVLIAMLLAMIGLMGSVAIQQTVLSANRNANDGQIAMRIATQTIEELNARVTMPGPVPVDLLAAIADGNYRGYPDRNLLADWIDANGHSQPAEDPAHRFRRTLRVIDGGFELPYRITVLVEYNLDSGTPKVVRLDVERRKYW